MIKQFCYKRITFLALIIAAMTVPFLNKPFHIDDTFALHITGSILANPLDPFAGDFDWFGYNQPVFDATTNPPFVSYYLAPFVALFGYSEIVLHFAMLLFIVIMAWAMYSLSERFTGNTFLSVLFVMTSCAVTVSGNVMRDIPAAALATAGIALFVSGTDRQNSKHLLLGSFLAGVAILTKYSAVITIPVLALYPFFKQKYRLMLWALLPLTLLLIWSLHNYIYYGASHVVYLTVHRRSEAGISWQDKLWGALVILGSISFLFALNAWKMLLSKDWLTALFSILFAFPAWYFVQLYFNNEADWFFLLMTQGGVVMLTACLVEAVRRGIPYLKSVRHTDASDTLFLFAWLCAPVIFSIFLVPFQATRHLILALPPLTLLAFRYFGSMTETHKWVVYAVLAVQAMIGFVVQCADYEYANVYRSFAEEAKEKWVSGDYETWYIGHWGWQFYADRAGFRHLHGSEEMPKEGDIILSPSIVSTDRNRIFLDNEEIQDRMELVEERIFEGVIPARTMNWVGASFYAVINSWGAKNMPYRFFQDKSLETMNVHRVGAQTDGN